MGRLPIRPSLALALAAIGACLAATPAAGAEPASSDVRALARHSLRAPLTRENFYFVMADRFANGTTANDEGGLTGDRLVTGFDPTHKGFYHGGDLIGLRERLDYINGLGTTAIWMTPSFKNRPVQGLGTPFVSAGYHGYWITDFTQIDPHLGSNQDLTDLIDASHARGMKVFFDIITNHTADVIDYAEKTYDYRAKAQHPYEDAGGTVFDDRDYAGTDAFPALDPLTSFPYTPVFANQADATVKKPDWLNDRTLYHNRGNSTFSGENSLYGDFFGLDDLFTENHEVVDGMIDVYRFWVREFGVDGFRIDTVKHVNTEFWQKFAPAILDEAHRAGKREFFMFGEVFDTSRPFLSSFTTQAKLQSVLDFAFQSRAQGFAASSKPTDDLRDLFVDDDWFTDADSNVYQLPTFLGNHDMGRIGRFVATDPANAGADDAELLARDRLAHQLMYFARGNPVVYYGDEQGFTGDGGDQDARQDMFASQVASYNDDDLIGTDSTTAQSNYSAEHPLYGDIALLAGLTQRHTALRDGAQQHRYSSAEAGIYGFSRIGARLQYEYVVALNNAEVEKTAAIPTYSARMDFNRIYGTAARHLRSGADKTLMVTVPPLSAVVYKARRPLRRSARATAVSFAEPAAGAEVRDRVELVADVAGDSFYEVSFAVKVADADAWTPLGTDDNVPHRAFFDAGGLTPGTPLRFLAVVRDNAGHLSSTTTRATVAPPRVPLTEAVIHYRRPDGVYDDWGLHLWGDAIADGVGTAWDAPRAPDGVDAYGAFWRIPLKDDTKGVNFIVHKPSGDTVGVNREPGGDRSFVPGEHAEAWLRQDDATVYFMPPGS